MSALLYNCKGNSQKQKANKTEITFRETSYNFGSVNIGDTVSYNFKSTNSGNKELVINEVKTSCGCTVPNYSAKVVSPGDTGSIEVKFETAGYLGHQNKSIFVYSNAQNEVKKLTIKAFVE